MKFTFALVAALTVIGIVRSAAVPVEAEQVAKRRCTCLAWSAAAGYNQCIRWNPEC
ncbi:hypothetical protein BGZ73_003120 [Actinomortierella ambigua]|nr:hypothetical protein BGZ73_003120 [Actinomortierella ambigua]